MKKSYDVLMFGHYAKDLLIVDDVERESPGGAVYYGSPVLRRLGLNVGIFTKGNPEDFHYLNELTDLGIDVFALPAEESSGCINIYQSADMERRICKLNGFAGEIPLETIPDDLTAKVIMITPIIAGEITLPTLIELAKRAPIALDVQGFVRVPEGQDLNFRPWPDMEEGLKHVTYLKVDRAEAEHMTGQTDLHEAAKVLAGYGPKEIILTQSDGVLVYADGEFYHGPFTPRSLDGRTGRGDTCITSYVGSRLTHSAAEAAEIAGIVTTMKQEVHGPWNGSIDPERFDAHKVYGDNPIDLTETEPGTFEILGEDTDYSEEIITEMPLYNENDIDETDESEPGTLENITEEIAEDIDYSEEIITEIPLFKDDDPDETDENDAMGDELNEPVAESVSSEASDAGIPKYTPNPNRIRYNPEPEPASNNPTQLSGQSTGDMKNAWLWIIIAVAILLLAILCGCGAIAFSVLGLAV